MSKEEFITNVVSIREKLENYAFRFLKDREEAEDIIQELYIKLWSMRAKLKEYDSVDALSFFITKNMCLNRIKVRQRQVNSDFLIDFKQEETQPDKLLIEKDNLEKALKIVDRLPTMQQAILKMRHLEGLEIAEIAELTGSNEGAIRVNLSRARKQVKQLFMKMEEK